jgi:hypothetical protein
VQGENASMFVEGLPGREYTLKTYEDQYGKRHGSAFMNFCLRGAVRMPIMSVLKNIA